VKPYLLPILLQIMGLAVIVAEIFIPSLGLLTLIALGVFFYSLYLVFTTISTPAGMVFAGLDIILIPVLVVLGMKLLAQSPLALKQELSKKDGVVSQRRELEALLSMTGVSVTDLRPAGMAEIDSQRVDVVTDGEYIDADTPIIVTSVSGNRIVVEKNIE
jgi:membrane-bound serine protease (ClpP class)